MTSHRRLIRGVSTHPPLCRSCFCILGYADSDASFCFEFVNVYKLDRFSRNKYEMAIHRKHLKDNGIKILSAMENIPDTPEGILLESLLEGSNSKNGQSVKI